MKLYKSQTGIAQVVMTLIAVLVLGGIGFAGWKVMQSKDTKQTSNQALNVDTANKDEKKNTSTDENYLTVKEWGIKVPTKEGKNIKYKMKTASGSGQEAIFYTDVSESICPDSSSYVNHYGISVNRGLGSDTIILHNSEKTTFKQLYDGADKTEANHTYYFKSFVLNQHYYLSSQSSYLACAEVINKEAKQPQLNAELDYLRSAIEASKLE